MSAPSDLEARVMKRVTGGVPGLLAAAVKDDVVTIKLQRQPTMADIPAYKS